MRTLDQYLLQFPKGAELDDARWLRLRILCLKNIDKACRSAAHTYLSGKDEASKASKTRVAQRIINFH
jgi:hypothetical protein